MILKGPCLLGASFLEGVMQSKMSGFKPDLISDFPGVEAAGSSGSHEFLGRVMGCKSFLSGFVQFRQSFVEGREEGFSQSRVRAGFVAIKQGEWGCLSGAMQSGVVVEFC